MGKFCPKHCTERTDHELGSRRAELSIRQRTAGLTPNLQQELDRIEGELGRREASATDASVRTAAMLQASKSDRTG